MRNDDLTDSVTGDWRQPGAPGAEEGAADAGSALKEAVVESPNCACGPGPARHPNDGI